MVAFARPALGCAHTVGFTDVFIARDGPPQQHIVLAYLMLFAALTNSVCLNNASLFFNIFFNYIFYDRAMSSPEK